MAINQDQEQFYRFQLLAPVGVKINTGVPLFFGTGTHAMACVAQTAQDPAKPTYDSNSGYITVQCQGSVNVAVKGSTSGSPSAGAKINRGDPVFGDGGTYDPVSGVTTGSILDADANGTFFGIALDPVAAGATTTIRVIMRNAL